jgi:small subunit ribosomal protein S7
MLNSLLINKFISIFMKKGKKAKIEKHFLKIQLKISNKNISPLQVITLAILNLKPLLELRKVKKKRKNFTVPFPVNIHRQISLAIKLIKNNVKNKFFFEDTLAEELIDCFNNKGFCLKNIRQSHKLILRNRIYKHYRWF